MHIGIASPITIQEFILYLDDDSKAKANNLIGLKAPAVDALVLGLLSLGHKISIYTLSSEVERLIILKGDKLSIFVNPLRKNPLQKALDLFKKELILYIEDQDYQIKSISFRYFNIY